MATMKNFIITDMIIAVSTTIVVILVVVAILRDASDDQPNFDQNTIPGDVPNGGSKQSYRNFSFLKQKYFPASTESCIIDGVQVYCTLSGAGINVPIRLQCNNSYCLLVP
jgi:hypothetical protein